MNNSRRVVLVDDHVLLRNGLAALVSDLGYTVAYECDNGRQLMEGMQKDAELDLVLMDINMPEMDGFETTLWLTTNFPSINVIALSMFDDELSIIRMLKNGAKGYILKDIKPRELKTAIESVLEKGFYHSDMVSGRLLQAIGDKQGPENLNHLLSLKKRDLEFLRLACSEMTYKEIASEMHVAPRTVDGYREEMFERLGVKSRVGLVLFVIKTRIVNFS